MNDGKNWWDYREGVIRPPFATGRFAPDPSTAEQGGKAVAGDLPPAVVALLEDELQVCFGACGSSGIDLLGRTSIGNILPPETVSRIIQHLYRIDSSRQFSDRF
jgi:hypothetical protein